MMTHTSNRFHTSEPNHPAVASPALAVSLHAERRLRGFVGRDRSAVLITWTNPAS